MIKLLIISLVLLNNNPKEIAKINNIKEKAEEAYLQGDFNTALEHYAYLTDSMRLEDPSILLNKAHCYYQLNDTSSAKLTYQNVGLTGDNASKSIAYQQLGVMAKSPQTMQESLQYLKASVKANPGNVDARYDYELVKKLLEQQQQQDQNQDQNEEQDQEEENESKEDQQKQDQQQSEDGEKDEQEQDQDSEQQQSEEEKEGEQKEEEQQQEEGEESDEEQQEEMSSKEKLEEMNISEEKARMILEALRNNEIQYIQQQKRKATKRPPSGKPDW